MNIFAEIKRKYLGHALKYVTERHEEHRPQDDIPDERVLNYIVRDYQRMYNERYALVTYIRSMENIYKTVQTDMFKITSDSLTGLPTKKRIVADIRKSLFDITNRHVNAQHRLRVMLGIDNDVEEIENSVKNKE